MGESDADENKKLAAIVVLTCLVLAIVFVLLVPKKGDEPPVPQRPTPIAPPPAVEVIEEPEAQPVEGEPSSAKGCRAKEPPFTGVGKLTHGVLYDRPAYIPRSYVPGEKHPVMLFVTDRLVSSKDRSVPGGRVWLPDTHDFFRVAEAHGIVIVATRGVGGGDQEFAHRAIDMAIENLCVDEDRIFAFGINRGAHSIAHALCDTPIRAIATAGGRAVPRCARPHIHFVETHDRTLTSHDEPDSDTRSPFNPDVCITLGGRALDGFTAGLQEVNGCKGFEEADDCKLFDCEVGLAVCTVDGGRMRTPRQSYMGNFATHGEPPRPLERPCFGKPNDKFAYALKAWGFFEMVSKATAEPGAESP